LATTTTSVKGLAKTSVMMVETTKATMRTPTLTESLFPGYAPTHLVFGR